MLSEFLAKIATLVFLESIQTLEFWTMGLSCLSSAKAAFPNSSCNLDVRGFSCIIFSHRGVFVQFVDCILNLLVTVEASFYQCL